VGLKQLAGAPTTGAEKSAPLARARTQTLAHGLALWKKKSTRRASATGKVGPGLAVSQRSPATTPTDAPLRHEENRDRGGLPLAKPKIRIARRYDVLRDHKKTLKVA
jgi:hypothetical protein